MTPRSMFMLRLAAVICLASASLIAVTGCDPRALAYFLQPFDPTIEPKGPPLTEKKVVILCNVTSGALAEFPSLERDVPRELTAVLRKKVKKIGEKMRKSMTRSSNKMEYEDEENNGNTTATNGDGDGVSVPPSPRPEGVSSPSKTPVTQRKVASTSVELEEPFTSSSASSSPMPPSPRRAPAVSPRTQSRV